MEGFWRYIPFLPFLIKSTDINPFYYREAQEDSDDDSDEAGGSAEENKEDTVKMTPKQNEETEFQRRQKELIQKQMQAQNEMIT